MDDITLNTPDRRRHQRTQLQMTLGCVRLDPDGGELRDTLHMANISRSGIGAICERMFYPGQRIVLQLPLMDGSGRRSIYASVMRCTPGNEGYNVGLEFQGVAAGAWYGSQAQTVAAAA